MNDLLTFLDGSPSRYHAVEQLRRALEAEGYVYSIPGKVPNPIDMPDYCYFRDRCEMCVEGCKGKYPHEIHLTDTHVVSCYRYAENGKEGK